jgi:hypothetical protein
MSIVNLLASLYSNVELTDKRDFNIFEILNLENDEVRLHSRILKYFIEKDIEGFIQSIPTEYWPFNNKPEGNSFLDVLIEVPAYSEHEILGDGRIDLLIRFNHFSIIIENKIYASDQNHQLIKYFKYGQTTGHDFLLIYLTPSGTMPQRQSFEIMDTVTDSGIHNLSVEKSFQLLSYKKNILSWLSRYQKNVKEFSVEHITLSQYIEVLNKICGIMDDKQKERIIGLMSNEAISSKLFYLKHDINTIESKIHDFWKKTAQQSHLAVSNISENTVCYKDGSIMLDIFQKSRNHINFYLEYKTNFHEAAFCGIWFNSSYLSQLQPILTKHKVQITDGFIDKKLIIAYSKESAIQNFINDKSENDIQDIVKEIEAYFMQKSELIREIKQVISCGSSE